MFHLSVLEQNEIEAIHQATLRLLSETGIRLSETESSGILAEAGAKLLDGRVLLPADLVEKCITLAGKRSSIRGRGGMTKTLGDGNLYFHNLGGALRIKGLQDCLLDFGLDFLQGSGGYILIQGLKHSLAFDGKKFALYDFG